MQTITELDYVEFDCEGFDLLGRYWVVYNKHNYLYHKTAWFLNSSRDHYYVTINATLDLLY